jgi:hypothetical protein
MSKQTLLGAVAAGALVLTALVTAGPAAAAVRYGVYVGPSYAYYPQRNSCWHWSYRLGEWVNFCRAYSYRYAYPDYGPYAYGYGPYYGGPYYNYGPSFGFGFSFGGGDRFHHHFH